MRVCPDCGSALVEFSSLAGGCAQCGVCKWEGGREDLLVFSFDNTMGAPADVILAIRNELRQIIAKSSSQFLTFLIRWGFVDAKQSDGKVRVTNKSQVVRYMNAIASGVLMSTLAERTKIEKERFDGN